MDRTTTVCTLWRLNLADGRVFAFTDHDRILTVDDQTYSPSQSLEETDRDQREGLRSDSGSVRGVFDLDSLGIAEIRAGALDGARLSRFHYDWLQGGEAVLLQTGRIGEVKTHGDGFEAEWLGLSSLLERSPGRVFSRHCDASFGDARCGVALSDYPEGTTCSRRFATCRDQFDNAVNFRGFPYLLGDDALQAAPRESDRRDGSSRYTHLRANQ